MSLAAFIISHENEIIDEWQKFAETCEPAANDLSPTLLRNHIRRLLRFIVDDISKPQTEEQRREKAQGRGKKTGGDSEAETHGEIRLSEGFDVMQVHSEFRALRASVLKLWSNEWARSNSDWTAPADVIPDLMRFNETIDQMVSESISRYVDKSGYPKPRPDMSEPLAKS